MGVVYKAVDTRVDRTVAIKVLPPDMTRDTIAKKRFIHEARASSALDHANTRTAHAIDETDEGQLFIVMAYYIGSSHAEVIAHTDPDLELILSLTIQACWGCTAAYMSPEQARGDSVDARTDQWSMGAVLYEILAGKHAFRGEYSQAII
jgi:serine/threonine protein kinase